MEFEVIRLLLGGGLLFFGRKLLWLFIGAAGFMFGFSSLQRMAGDLKIWYYLGVGIICGIILVVLVRSLKNIAFGVGGFLLGAYFASGLMNVLQLELGMLQWLVMLIMGAGGAALMLTLFDWSAVILSSGLGALLLIQSLPLAPPASQIIFFGLLLLGLVLQIKKSQPSKFAKTPNLSDEIGFVHRS